MVIIWEMRNRFTPASRRQMNLIVRERESERSSVLFVSLLMLILFVVVFITMESMWSCDQIVLFHRYCLSNYGHAFIEWYPNLLLFFDCSFVFVRLPCCLFNLRIMDFNKSDFLEYCATQLFEYHIRCMCVTVLFV